METDTLKIPVNHFIETDGLILLHMTSMLLK